MADGGVVLAAAFAMALLGFGWVALAMRAHWRQVFDGDGPTRTAQRRLRVAGACALALSLASCLAADRVSMALLEWPMLLAAAASCIAGSLQARPSMLRWLCPGSRWLE